MKRARDALLRGDPVPHAALSLSAEQRAVVDFVEQNLNASIFLTGEAGTGKSYALKAIVERLRARNVKVAITASTGRAAADIDEAITVHSWAGLGVDLPRNEEDFELLVAEIKRRRAFLRWKVTQTLIIDEVSMVRVDLFNLLDRLGRTLRQKPTLPFGGLRLILVGDFFQLPPVTTDKDAVSTLPPYSGLTIVEVFDNDEEDEAAAANSEQEQLFAFEAEAWRALRPRTFDLQTVWRQHEEPEFIKHLRAVRRGQLPEATRAALASRVVDPLPQASAERLVTHIMPLNREVDTINSRELMQLKGKPRVYNARDFVRDPRQPNEAWFKNMRAPFQLELRVGAQVMVVRNMIDEGLVNGSVGRVVGFDATPGAGGYPYVKFPAHGRWPERTRLMKPVTWDKRDGLNGPILVSRTQVPLILAWAVSSHKSQGQTITCDVVASLASVFEYGQAYVILSRVQRLEQLYLESFDPRAIRAHPRVLSAFPAST